MGFSFYIFFLFSLNYTRVSRAKLHKSASGSCFYTIQCSIRAATLYTTNKVTKKSPAENCFCQVTCPTLHPSMATTHSKSIWTACLFFSVLVVPCYFGCFNPAMAARSANNDANVFLYSFHVPAHSPRWQHQTIFPCLSPQNQIKPSFSILSAYTSRWPCYLVLQFHSSCHLQDCTVT